MRVLFNQWSTSGKRTGVGHVAHQLALHLNSKADIDLTAFPSTKYLVWDHRFQAAGEWLRSLRARWKSSPAKRLFSPLAIFRCVARRVRQSYLDHYHRIHRQAFFGDIHDIYHEPNFLPFESSLPTVTTLHDLSVLLHPEWHPADRVKAYERNFSRTLRQTTRFITVSEFTRWQTIKHLGIHPSRVTTIPNAARPEFQPLEESQVVQRLRALNLPSQYLLYVGTLEPRKNLMRLMNAYISLPDAIRSQYPLLLAGQWGWNIEKEREFYETEAKHRGVRHLGYVRDADLPYLLNGARALVYPSMYEGFGLPPLEMMACGGAVIASNIPPIREVAGSQAHLVQPEDTDAWRAALHRVVTDDDWQELLRAGASRFASRFNWQRAAREHVDLYRNMLSRAAIPMRRVA